MTPRTPALLVGALLVWAACKERPPVKRYFLEAPGTCRTGSVYGYMYGGGRPGLVVLHPSREAAEKQAVADGCTLAGTHTPDTVAACCPELPTPEERSPTGEP